MKMRFSRWALLGLCALVLGGCGPRPLTAAEQAHKRQEAAQEAAQRQRAAQHLKEIARVHAARQEAAITAAKQRAQALIASRRLTPAQVADIKPGEPKASVRELFPHLLIPLDARRTTIWAKDDPHTQFVIFWRPGCERNGPFYCGWDLVRRVNTYTANPQVKVTARHARH